MKFYSPSQLAEITPRSRFFWIAQAKAGALPGATFLAKTPSASRTQLAVTVRGDWWIPQSAIETWLAARGLPAPVVVRVAVEPVKARTQGELRRKVAA